MTSQPWFPFRAARTRAAVHLLCFPCAGAGASLYRPWRDAAPPFVDVLPVELPGRGRRFREVPVSEMEPLIAALVPAIIDALDDHPIALFGHSMGALIAFEASKALGPRVRRLFVSGSSAPHFRIGTRRSELSDDDLRGELGLLGGTPSDVLANEELMQLLLPMLRADFALVDSYQCSPAQKAPCPITVFAGTRDPYVSFDTARAWDSYTSSSFRFVAIEGHHFYLDTAGGRIVEEMARDLAPRAESV